MKSAGQEKIALDRAEQNTHVRISLVASAAPLISKRPFYFSDLAILFLTTLISATYKLCPSFDNDPKLVL
jgi:hypothetical protein